MKPLTLNPVTFCFAVVVSAGALLLICYLVYLYLQFESTQITEGTYFGLTIGDSKAVAYEKVPRALFELNRNDSRIFTVIKADDKASRVLAMGVGRPAMVQSSLDPVGFERFQEEDQWSFYISASYLNSLSLRFCDDRLCHISRVKMPFELP